MPGDFDIYVLCAVLPCMTSELALLGVEFEISLICLLHQPGRRCAIFQWEMGNGEMEYENVCECCVEHISKSLLTDGLYIFMI